ncbi:MAG: alpha/beta hydrolase [Bacilli bacterium]
MKKKLLLVVLFILILLVGCGNKGEEVNEYYGEGYNVTINYSHDYSYYKYECAQLEQEQNYKNVIIIYHDADEYKKIIGEREFRGSSDRSPFIAQILANNQYNVVYLVQANNGYTNALKKTTLDILEIEKSAFKEGKCNYFVGGISHGGKTAIKMMVKNQDSFDGLLLYANTLSRRYDLSETDKKVFCMYGSCDTVLTPKDIEDSKKYYPSNSVFYEISGGTNEGMNLLAPIPDETIIQVSNYPISPSLQMSIMANETYNYMYQNILSMEGDIND